MKEESRSIYFCTYIILNALSGAFEIPTWCYVANFIMICLYTVSGILELFIKDDDDDDEEIKEERK